MSKSAHPKSATGHISEPFYENSPRPPAVGEEQDINQRGCSPVPFKYPQYQPSGAHQPRRSALHGYVPQHSFFKDSAPMGFEPEGCSAARVFSESPPPTRSPPGYLRWARTLSILLDDPEGVELFKRYVEQEGGVHVDRLNFYFACEGVKNQTDPMKRKQMVEVVYRFLKKSQLTIPDDLRRRIKTAVKDENVSANIFDSMQTDVVRLINETTYPNFLHSDTYLAHVQAMQNAEGCLGLLPSYTPSDSCSSSGSSSAQMLSCSQSTTALPTLHEDSVLMLEDREHLLPVHPHPVVESPIRLTKSNIMATQRDRLEPMQRNEIFNASFLPRRYSVYSHPHAAYSSYNPVSRQDSELQSLSSGRTDSDKLSMSGSSVDGNHTRLSRRQHSHHDRSISKYNMNQESLVHTVIPRTQREKAQPNNDPAKFMADLFQKLEILKRDQDSKEKLDRKLEDTEGGSNTKSLAEAIREKFPDDDNDQDILDQHVSRVWSDLTPSRSPGVYLGGDTLGEGSPRPSSPPGHYLSQSQSSKSNTHHHHAIGSRRKERDQISMFSIDSGNVQDYYDGTQLSGSTYGVGDHRHRASSSAMSKSRSIPDCDAFVRHNVARRSSSKRTVTDFDSGVSVLSEYPPRSRDTKLLSRSMEVQSSDRRRREHNNPPTQPYLTDRSIPVPQPPNTATQLEEARKRLLMEDERGRQKQRYSSKTLDTTSAQSTLRRSVRRPNVSGVPSNPLGSAPPDTVQTFTTSGEQTVVVFSFCDEEFPYRTKIPGTTVTLKQFKEVLPKRGNYRFFFKNVCEELENQVIQEEIVNDADTLPLWEGKVMAQVKSCD